MTLSDSVNEFYFCLVLKNLRSMNRDRTSGGLTYNSFLYLEVIRHNKNCTPSYLAETLRVARPAVTVKINELAAKGLVIKTQGVSDKRVCFLKISPKAARICKSFDASLAGAIKEVRKKFGKEEINACINMLDIIINYREEI
ncbi:MarR family transcriptional regulator [Brucepastera parasyntrophica]|uniref:MarR family winged helix-turn-helix transcriptional regulator n=1 Tax=Brucepastera parasyntrophica TaxID=2880008 RepID=UPI00210CA34C|nr:MarR family transcriptional regulator [Brucepastera parasyntrophica]ULQ58668.1 MarR family transcriptional regulator [Brucepastera parasyntrophica]